MSFWEFAVCIVFLEIICCVYAAHVRRDQTCPVLMSQGDKVMVGAVPIACKI